MSALPTEPQPLPHSSSITSNIAVAFMKCFKCLYVLQVCKRAHLVVCRRWCRPTTSSSRAASRASSSCPFRSTRKSSSKQIRCSVTCRLSVTRCWSKKKPNILRKWVTFLRNFVLKNIQKSPKLATLPVVDVLKQFLEQT